MGEHADETVPFLPPGINGGHSCSWHVLVIGKDEDDRWVLHPDDCPVTVTSGGPMHGTMRYECLVSHSMEAAGYSGIFDRDGTDLKVGTWLLRSYIVTLRGFDWTERDQAWEIIRLVEGEYDLTPIGGSEEATDDR